MGGAHRDQARDFGVDEGPTLLLRRSRGSDANVEVHPVLHDLVLRHAVEEHTGSRARGVDHRVPLFIRAADGGRELLPAGVARGRLGQVVPQDFGPELSQARRVRTVDGDLNRPSHSPIIAYS